MITQYRSQSDGTHAVTHPQPQADGATLHKFGAVYTRYIWYVGVTVLTKPPQEVELAFPVETGKSFKIKFNQTKTCSVTFRGVYQRFFFMYFKPVVYWRAGM